MIPLYATLILASGSRPGSGDGIEVVRDMAAALVDFFLHLDTYLADTIHQYGGWTYALLFVVIFLETGLVVTPFLPGDSLLFAAGSLAAMGALDVRLLLVLLLGAAVLGDTVNYWIGHAVGPRAFKADSRFLKRKHLEKTQRFYEKHGGKAIVLARFVPVVRTLAPFVAGVGSMRYGRFLAYNVGGGVAWTALLVALGYSLGTIPLVREHFEVVVIGIVLVSIVPMALGYLRDRLRRPGAPSGEIETGRVCDPVGPRA
jgi:membrane-associated protein